MDPYKSARSTISDISRVRQRRATRERGIILSEDTRIRRQSYSERLQAEEATHRRWRNIGIAAVALVSAAWVGGVTLLERTRPVSDIPAPACEFSAETTAVTIPPGAGAADVLLQISGVSYDACMDDATEHVAALNPDRNLKAPQATDSFVIPMRVLP